MAVMEKRRLGRTEHMSSIVTFGCYALSNISQNEADGIIEFVLSRGVNHFDVAPSYGEAELRIGPWMNEHRPEIFLACKTDKRTRKEARKELEQSLNRMKVDYVDLYQFHALDTLDELDTAFGPDGALQTMLEARDSGIVKYIGITSHNPLIATEALKRFDLDTVLFPLNFVLRKHRCSENDYESLLQIAKQKDVGTIVMKAFAKGPWASSVEDRSISFPYTTWYEPFDNQSDIDRCLQFALSQDVATVVSAGDIRLVPKIIDASQRYRRLTMEEQIQLVESAENLRPLFPSTS